MIDNISSEVIIDITENELVKTYKTKYDTLAEYTIKQTEEEKTHIIYRYPKEEGTWYIPTKVQTYPIMLEELIKIIGTREFEKGIDLGCGMTTFFEFIPVAEPWLIDIATPYCEYQKNRGYQKVLNINIEKMVEIPSNYFDLIVASDVLEHVLSLNSVLAEIERIAKKGSILCVNVPWNQKLGEYNSNFQWEWGRLSKMEHLRSFGNHNVATTFKNWKILSCREIIEGDKYKWIRTANIIMEK